MENYFKANIEIISDALASIDSIQYNKLLAECEATLKNGKKIIVSGLGKNVPVCDKFTGTMLSLGFNANFLHTNSAVHGDMGMVKPGDTVIILSKSGNTTESVYLANLLMKRGGINLWALTFSRQNQLVERVGPDKSLVVSMTHEGDMWNIVPNNSTTINLIVLQSIAMRLTELFKLDLNKDFKPNHPGGAIGATLRK